MVALQRQGFHHWSVWREALPLLMGETVNWNSCEMIVFECLIIYGDRPGKQRVYFERTGSLTTSLCLFSYPHHHHQHHSKDLKSDHLLNQAMDQYLFYPAHGSCAPW